MPDIFRSASDFTKAYASTLVPKRADSVGRVHVLLFNRVVLGVFSTYQAAEAEAVGVVRTQSGHWQRERHIWLGPDGTSLQISTHDVR